MCFLARYLPNWHFLRKIALADVHVTITHALKQLPLLMWPQHPYQKQPRHQQQMQFLYWAQTMLQTSPWSSTSMVKNSFKVNHVILVFRECQWRSQLWIWRWSYRICWLWCNFVRRILVLWIWNNGKKIGVFLNYSLKVDQFLIVYFLS